MKILFVIPTMGTGGAERVVSLLSNAFSSDMMVKIYTMEKAKEENYKVNNEIEIISANSNVIRKNKLFSLLSFVLNFYNQRRLLKKTIKEYAPNIIISFLPKADFLVSTINSKKYKYKWISSERNDPNERNIFERTILNIIYRKTDAFVCQTKKIKNYYENKKVSNIDVIYNPVNIPKIDTDYMCSREKMIISVGRLDSQKNFQMLIKAFSQIENKKGYTLHIFGSGNLYSELDNTIKNQNLTNCVILEGRKKDIDKYYKKASIFVMSSNYEGMPNALLEAMSYRLPVICTNFYSGAALEFIDDENGILVPVKGEAEMQKALEKVINLSEEKLQKMGEKSYKKVISLSSDKIIKKWKQLVIKISKGDTYVEN